MIRKIIRKYQMTVSQLMDDYAENRLVHENFAIGTRNNYLSVMRMTEKTALAGKKVRKIRTEDLQEFFEQLSAGYNDEEGNCHEPISRSRLCAYSALFTHVFDYAVFPLRILKENPMQHAEIRRSRRETDLFSGLQKKEKTLHHEQYLAIVDYLREKDNPALLAIQIAYYTGLRLGEVTGLTWDDVHLDECYLTVRRAVVLNCEKKNRLEFTTPKRDRNRHVSFPDTLKQILLKERKRAEKRSVRNYYVKINENGSVHYPLLTGNPAERNRIPVNLVCVRKDGSYLNRRSLACLCTRLNDCIDGLKGFHFHMLRHTYATNLLTSGMNMQEVKELLGHNDIRTTMNIYAHNRDSELLRKVRKLDEL